jgi:NAD(P)-dependent dehydrogenase (short-subunit alcohol dehydrogenase family)
VTGAAGQGIGRAIAERLLQGGANVVVSDVHARRVTSVTAQLAAVRRPYAVSRGGLAEAVAFLAGDRARFITGETLNIAAGAFMPD